MNWWELLAEMALLSLLGVGYYYFQKRRYLRWLKEDPQILAKDLFVFLNAEEAIPNSSELSTLLASLEDFLEQRRTNWPVEELKKFHASVPQTLPSDITKKLDQAFELALKLFA
jgi:hypothetical protein